MAYMPLPNVYPNMNVPYVEYIRRPLIESDAVLLLIVEVIDYSLRYHNLHNWAPTWNLDFLRMNNATTYFNENFALTVVSPNTEGQAIRLANTLGFNLRRWLHLIDPERTRLCMEYYLLAMYYFNKPFLFQMFSFACYASRMAMQSNLNNLVNDVVWALLLALRKIIPYGEYYGEFCVVANIHDNRHVNNQLLDLDEGIWDTTDADNSSMANDGSLPSIFTDPIVLFVKEVIDCALRYNNFYGFIPPQDLLAIHRTEMRYFDENLGIAITHNCLEEDAIQAAYAWGFDEETWLGLYRPAEARSFQVYYLAQVFHTGNQCMLRMLSFACYASKIAKQRNLDSLVDAVEYALVDTLRCYFPYGHYYRNLKDSVFFYNSYHYDLHSQSDDEGVSTESSSGADSSEEATASESDNAENEAEERREALYLEVGDEEIEESGSGVLEATGIDASTERSKIEALGESGIDASTERTEIEALEESGSGVLEASGSGVLEASGSGVLEASGSGVLEASGSGVLEASGSGVLEAGGINASTERTEIEVLERSGSDVLEERRGMHILKK